MSIALEVLARPPETGCVACRMRAAPPDIHTTAPGIALPSCGMRLHGRHPSRATTPVRMPLQAELEAGQGGEDAPEGRRRAQRRAYRGADGAIAADNPVMQEISRRQEMREMCLPVDEDGCAHSWDASAERQAPVCQEAAKTCLRWFS